MTIDIPLNTPDGPADDFAQKAIYDRVMSRMTTMCKARARLYLAMMNTEKDTDERTAALTRIKAHDQVCGCQGKSGPQTKWIWT